MIRKSLNFIPAVLLATLLWSMPICAADGFGLPVLMYHAVDDDVRGLSELFVKPAEFEKHIKYLADNGYTAVLFDDLCKIDTVEKPVIITFDDGYDDNYHNAYPILKKYGFRAVIFLIVNDLNTPGYLAPYQVTEMSDLISFQSHTLNHLALDRVSRSTLESECTLSKRAIEELTGEPVNVISYPYGLWNRFATEVVSHHYDYAVTTRPGYYKSTDDSYLIKRVRIQRSDSVRGFIAKLTGLYA